MIAGINKVDQQIAVDLRDHMQQRHTLRLKRRTHRDLGPESVNCPGDNFLRRPCFKFFRELFDLERRQHGGIIPVTALQKGFSQGTKDAKIFKS